MPDYDAIVIGAGNAGLTAAATLQRGGQRTLLLERHNIPGGCATSFVRGHYEFEVALHQLSGMGTEQQPAALRNLFGELGVLDRLTFIEEDELYRFVVPGEVDITLPADFAQVSAKIQETFPETSENIGAFLKLCELITMERMVLFPDISKSGDLERLKRECPNVVKYAVRPARDVMKEFFSDDRIIATLGAYWGYLGLPLDELSFGDIALLLFAYATFKPYHIQGGSQALSNALLESFLEAGGEVRFNCGAKRILTEDRSIRAVEVESGEVLTCRNVVSNTSAIHTYNEMLDIGDSCTKTQQYFTTRKLGMSGFVIYLGLDCTPEELGVTAPTTFISAVLDERADFDRATTLDAPLGCALTCYSLADDSFAPAGKSVAALMCAQFSEPWDEVKPEHYAATKYAFAEKLLDLAERVFPDIRSHIEEAEAATPRTMMRFLNTPGGVFYGFQQSRLDLTMAHEQPYEVAGLHLAGSWAGMGGFQPAYSSGVGVANSILGTNAPPATAA